ncbi:MAG: hypothetical protein KDD61_05305 [Bdellovibrionales bacterium]|nr:hypothetical protein [Bdellovibrionales bacterium]
MKYTEILRNEHKEIHRAHMVLNHLRLHEAEIQEEDFQAALAFLVKYFDEFVVQLHFKKEEEILFPLVHKNLLDQKGGPRCGDFVGRTQMWQYAAQVIELGKQEISAPYPVAESLQQLLQGKPSGLSIPLEEHEGTYYGVELLKKMMRGEWFADKPQRNKLIKLFLNLVDEHREKEDTCLLVAFERLASDELQEEMYKQWQKLENTFGLTRIQSFKADLQKWCNFFQVPG